MLHLFIQSGFVILTIVSYAFLFFEIKKAINLTAWPSEKKSKAATWVLIIFLTWAIFVSIWSLSGKMANFEIFPLNMMPVFAIPFIAILLFTFSKPGKEILSYIPAGSIVRLQTFRFFVELLLWALYIEKLAPVQMTFEGRNLDVLSGITAPFIAYLIGRGKLSKPVLMIWNIACLALLVNIVATAILSMPTPLRHFMDEPANTIVTKFPVSWLPGMLVPLAYGLHFFSLRQLFLKK